MANKANETPEKGVEMDVIIKESDLMRALDAKQVTYNLRQPSTIEPTDVYEILKANSGRLAVTANDVGLGALFDD